MFAWSNLTGCTNSCLRTSSHRLKQMHETAYVHTYTHRRTQMQKQALSEPTDKPGKHSCYKRNKTTHTNTGTYTADWLSSQRYSKTNTNTNKHMPTQITQTYKTKKAHAGTSAPWLCTQRQHTHVIVNKPEHMQVLKSTQRTWTIVQRMSTAKENFIHQTNRCMHTHCIHTHCCRKYAPRINA
jgi:hypothetical protein